MILSTGYLLYKYCKDLVSAVLFSLHRRNSSIYLSKVPQHLAIVMDSIQQVDDHAIQKLSQIVHWANELRICNVSFYDKQGMLEQHFSSISNYFLEHLHCIFGEKAVHVTIAAKENQVEMKQEKEKECDMEGITIRLLSNETCGKPNFVEWTKRLCSNNEQTSKNWITEQVERT